MINQSKINDQRFWAKWIVSGAVGQFLTNYIPAEQDVKTYIHPNPRTLELQRQGCSAGHYIFDFDGKSAYEERRDLGEQVLGFKGAKILMAQFYDTRIKEGKHTSRTVVIVPGILMGNHRDGRTEFGLDTSKIAVLPKSQKAEVKDLAKKNFPNADCVWIW